MAEKEDKGFLNRWSERKQARRQEEPLPPEPGEETAGQQPALSAEEEAARQKEIDDYVAALPEPESLTYESDFTAFFKEGVPEVLKRRAMKVLWRSNPILANLDGLIDYGGDFTDKAMVVPNLKTLYRVGKGMFTDEDLIKEDRRRAGLPPLPPEEPAEAEENAEKAGSEAESAESAPEDRGAPESDEPSQETASEEDQPVDQAEKPALEQHSSASMKTPEPAEAGAARDPARVRVPVHKKRPVLARRWGPDGDPSS